LFLFFTVDDLDGTATNPAFAASPERSKVAAEHLRQNSCVSVKLSPSAPPLRHFVQTVTRGALRKKHSAAIDTTKLSQCVEVGECLLKRAMRAVDHHASSS
jgi:hypothetical protein